jgi:hypothetical protein
MRLAQEKLVAAHFLLRDAVLRPAYTTPCGNAS